MAAIPLLPDISLPGVWLLRLDEREPAGAFAVLSEDERMRAERFRLTADRMRFVATRAALRLLLGRCLGTPPGSLSFAYSPLGQPRLAGGRGASGPAFSVAHSGRFALLGLSREPPLGVDIEDLAIDRDTGRIAKAILSAGEHRGWFEADPAVRKASLLQVWTRREAVAKALGVGLSLTSQAFEQALSGPDRLAVADLPAAEGCVAAIAAPAAAPPFRLAEFAF